MEVRFCKTKAENGCKILVDEKWLFTSIEHIKDVLNEVTTSCLFQPFKEDEEE